MAKVKESMVEQITNMDVDFAQWYTDVIKKAELADYSSVKGFIIVRPYGFAIWEAIQGFADRRFKDTGHENVSMPLLIPESLLQKEKDHVEGFAPEVAWVTHGGTEELQERLCIRPTSETLFCDHYAQIIQSYRDLPKLYNQWCSVMRWEKTTRPFLRGREFRWQEGHTAHATAEEAQEETLLMLDIYAEVFEDFLAIPVLKGQKTESEKFAGAKATYGVECLMHDGKALQGGTTHNFGDGFARAFEIQYSDKDGSQKYVHQTSWGISERMIGAIVMVHGDNSGLVLPPRLAPIQVVIVPIAMHKGNVLPKAAAIKESLAGQFRVKIDSSDKSPGWKFAEYEMKGVPIRLEIGPKDIENNQCVLVRRDTGEKTTASLDTLSETIDAMLKDIQSSLYNKALENRKQKTFYAKDYGELTALANKQNGFYKAMWCGSPECEQKIKAELGITSRCIPFEQEHVADTCVCCGKKAETMVLWGRAY